MNKATSFLDHLISTKTNQKSFQLQTECVSAFVGRPRKHLPHI